MSAASQLEAVLALALPLRDVLEGRVDDDRVPSWCERRGWAPFLLSLSDDEVRYAEAHGLAATLARVSGAPTDLVELAQSVRRAVKLPMVEGSAELSRDAVRNVRLRKRAQLAGLLSAVAPMAACASRIVDVGAGSGHFTRLSAELFERDALGLERSAERVAAATLRASNSRASFIEMDARNAMAFASDDLAIGLHACGELGDRLVEAAARARCQLALVSCCLQKISPPVRAPLSKTGEGGSLRREHLGLANLTARAEGVEASIEVTIAARQTRYALGQLLRARGVTLEPGAEMSGINRRQAQAGLASVAARALALRNLSPATAAEVADHEQRAATSYASVRRLSLPRSMLARLVEVLVSLDRAAHLEEAGLSVLVATLFDAGVSPRNIGIFAAPQASVLPRPGGPSGERRGEPPRVSVRAPR